MARVTFTSVAPPADVYRFYAQRAAASGWRPTGKGALALTDVWTKTYSNDGAAATLLLSLLGDSQGAKHVYSLGGGIAPVSS